MKKVPSIDLGECTDCESCLELCPRVFRRNEETGHIEVVDLCELPTEVRDEDSQHLILREAQAPFDLEQGPLFRVVLVRLSSQNNLALFTLHHIISDGWSMGILIRDVINIYQSKLNEQQAKLPEIDVQYADYAV